MSEAVYNDKPSINKLNNSFIAESVLSTIMPLVAQALPVSRNSKQLHNERKAVLLSRMTLKERGLSGRNDIMALILRGLNFRGASEAVVDISKLGVTHQGLGSAVGNFTKEVRAQTGLLPAERIEEFVAKIDVLTPDAKNAERHRIADVVLHSLGMDIVRTGEMLCNGFEMATIGGASLKLPLTRNSVYLEALPWETPYSSILKV